MYRFLIKLPMEWSIFTQISLSTSKLVCFFYTMSSKSSLQHPLEIKILIVKVHCRSKGPDRKAQRILNQLVNTIGETPIAPS